MNLRIAGKAARPASTRHALARPGIPYVHYVLAFTLIAFGCKSPTEPEAMPPELRLRLETLAAGFANSGQSLSVTAELSGSADSTVVSWTASGGSLSAETGMRIMWTAPGSPGRFTVRAKATNAANLSTIDSVRVTVGNRAPSFVEIMPDQPVVVTGNLMRFTATAMDSDGHALTFDWIADQGEIQSASGNTMVWRAPEMPQSARIQAIVRDNYAGTDTAETHLIVYREAGTAWVADTGNREVVKISADGQVLFRKSGFAAPTAIGIDTRRRMAWVIDNGNKTLTQLDLDGTVRATQENLGGPADIDIMQVNGHAWLVESDSGRVREFSNDGATVLRAIHGFTFPVAAAIDQRTGEIYIADTGEHRVIQIQRTIPNGYHIGKDTTGHKSFAGFDAPVDLAVDFQSHEVWVVDRFLETVLTLRGEERYNLGVSGLRRPNAVALDPVSGTAWIADTGSGRVVKINKQSILSQVSGFWLPQSLALDTVDGSVWVADTENNRIVKCTADGELLFSLYGFSSPSGISVNAGQ